MSEPNGSNGNGKRAIVSRETLLPLGFALAFGGACYLVGGIKSDIYHGIDGNVRAIEAQEKRLAMAEARLEIWRRYLEVKLEQPLPEPKDVADRPPALIPIPPPQVAAADLTHDVSPGG